MLIQIIKNKLERYKYDLSIINQKRVERSGYNKWTSTYTRLTREIKKVGIISNKEVKKLRDQLKKLQN